MRNFCRKNMCLIYSIIRFIWGYRSYEFTLLGMWWRSFCRHFCRVNGEYAWYCGFFRESHSRMVNYLSLCISGKRYAIPDTKGQCTITFHWTLVCNNKIRHSGEHKKVLVQGIVPTTALPKIRNFHRFSPEGRTAGRPVAVHRYQYAGISRSFLWMCVPNSPAPPGDSLISGTVHSHNCGGSYGA